MPDLYEVLIAEIFSRKYKPGKEEFEFRRDELQAVASELGVELPKNLGDVIYSYRYRRSLPKNVLKTAPKGKEWIIVGAGRSKYRFRLTALANIEPRPDMIPVKIPDATPQIISLYALSDEQALLAKVRYNRLVDVFLGLTAYSLQSHLRSTVKGVGQMEIDELYVGVSSGGQHFSIPVQAKGGTDRLSIVQSEQDIKWCLTRFPALTCRAISAQFMADDVIALFEIRVDDEQAGVVRERHYTLVPKDEISDEDLERYKLDE